MLNHFYTVLYNFSKEPPSGIEVLLTERLILPDILDYIQDKLGGTTVEERDLFAIKSLKILDSSSYRERITSHDSRITYDITEVSIDTVNYSNFISKWLNVPNSAINYILYTEELKDTFRSSPIPMEKVASLIVGYVDTVTSYNE